ncbi:hypothetical protein ACLB2K_012498 [Fragaria x ananassa]
MFNDNVLSDVDKEIKLGFDGFDATQYLDDKAAMTYQDFREQFLSYNYYCTKEASRCGGGNEESRPSVGASTAAMLLQKFGSTMRILKRKLQKNVAGYDDDEDEEDDVDEEDGVKQQKVLVQEKNKEGGEQRDENKHIKGLHKENVDNIVIVLSDEEEEEEEEEEDVKEQIDDHDLHRHGDGDEVVEESEEIGEESEEEEEGDEEFTFDGESDFCLSLGKKRKNTREDAEDPIYNGNDRKRAKTPFFLGVPGSRKI